MVIRDAFEREYEIMGGQLASCPTGTMWIEGGVEKGDDPCFLVYSDVSALCDDCVKELKTKRISLG